MRNKIQAFSEIGFNDSTYEGCEMFDDILEIFIKLWDDKNVKIVFTNPILFFYKSGCLIEGVYRINEKSYLLNEALSFIYDKIPEKHQFSLYQIIDIDDYPFFQIVAEKVDLQYL